MVTWSPTNTVGVIAWCNLEIDCMLATAARQSNDGFIAKFAQKCKSHTTSHNSVSSRVSNEEKSFLCLYSINGSNMPVLATFLTIELASCP